MWRARRQSKEGHPRHDRLMSHRDVELGPGAERAFEVADFLGGDDSGEDGAQGARGAHQPPLQQLWVKLCHAHTHAVPLHGPRHWLPKHLYRLYLLSHLMGDM